MAQGWKDPSDLEQATALAAEVDVEIAAVRARLDALAVKDLTPRTRRQINAARHDLATMQLLRFRLQDRFGV